MKVTWQWEHFGGPARSAASTSSDGLIDSSLSVTELLAREITQNSDDAMDVFRTPEYADVHRPGLTYRFVSLTGAKKRAVVDILDLRDIGAHAPFVSNPRTMLDMTSGTCLAALDDAEVPLRVLYIEERGAIGLEGNPITHPDTSRWYLALEAQGVSFHEGESQSGGTYGFGKAAARLGSLLCMVVAYSKFRENERDDANRRFGGYVHQYFHRMDSVPFTGFASFGVSTASGDGSYYVEPYKNNDADRYAEALGMSRPDTGDVNTFGTTFMILDPDITPRDLSEALARNWWPAILSGKIELNVIDYDGESIPPRPKRYADLMPFMEAWNIANGLSEPKSHQILRNLQGIEIDGTDRRMGRLALVADESTCFDRSGEEGESRASTVALIRQRKMVVAYQDFLENRPPFVQGVLFSDEDIEKDLAFIEPKDHSRWWLPSSARVKSDWPEHRRTIVKALYDRTYRHLVNFRSSLRVQADEETVRLDRLSRLLGNMLRSRGRRGRRQPADARGSAPVVLNIPDRGIRRVENPQGVYTYTAPVRLTLEEDAGFESTSAEVEVVFSFVEDTGGQGDRITTVYSDLPEGWVVSGNSVTGTLTRQGVKFKASSEPINGPFAVNIDPVVSVQVPVKAIAEESTE